MLFGNHNTQNVITLPNNKHLNIHQRQDTQKHIHMFKRQTNTSVKITPCRAHNSAHRHQIRVDIFSKYFPNSTFVPLRFGGNFVTLCVSPTCHRASPPSLRPPSIPLSLHLFLFHPPCLSLSLSDSHFLFPLTLPPSLCVEN